MGNQLDRLGGYEDNTPSALPPGHCVDDLPVPTSSYREADSSARGRKRNGEQSSEDSSKSKIKKLDTAKYVYERLFKKGEDSDITIHAMGRSWNLHKFYLEQCKYFEEILKEKSNEKSIELNITDENVTPEGLDSVLASLYLNDIEINLENINGILAASFLIGLDSVVARCEETMIENMTEINVVQFHDIANTYGLPQVQQLALENLKKRFWKFMRNRSLLSDMSESLLNSLLCSSDLLVADSEIDLYRMIKSWIFLHECSDRTDLIDLPEEEFQSQSLIFFQSSEPNYLFLKYTSLFTPLRMHHFLNSAANINMVESDNLIPRQIITAISAQQWRSLLRNEENYLLINELTYDDFNLNALRIGKEIDSLPKCWRCTDFNYGIDILLNITNYSLTMKRNCISQSTPFMVNLRSERTVHYRVIIIDSIGSPIFDSYKTSATLRPDQSIVIARVPDNITLPISVHFQYVSSDPPPPSFLFINEFIRNNNLS